MSFILRILLFCIVFYSSLMSENSERLKVLSLPLNGRNEIFLVEGDKEGSFKIKNLSKNFPGHNYDPYLFFHQNSPSVVWANKNKGMQSIVIYSNNEYKIYILNLSFELASPVVEEDPYGRLLLLIPSPSGLLYSFLDSRIPCPVPLFSLPSFFLSAKKDDEGKIWIAWAGFDGNDWEIYLTNWDGLNFSEIHRITNNNYQDVEPSITLNPFDVIWKIYINGEGLIRSLEKLSIFEGEKEEKSSEIDINSFIAFGDSITYGMVDYKPEAEGYVPRLERLLKEAYSNKMKVLNRGIPGEDTVGGLSRIEKVIKDDPSLYILIMEGTNDVWHYPAWFTALNLEEMIKISISYKMKPLIANLIPKAFWAEFLNPRIEEINKYIIQIAQKYKVPLVDQYNSFMSYPEEKGGWRALYSGHNHPNEEGYQLMAEVWFDSISRLPRFKEKEYIGKKEKIKKDKFNFNSEIYK